MEENRSPKTPKLFTPGPTRVPEALLRKMAEPIIHHRSSAFKAELEQIQKKLRQLFKTAEPVLLLTTSGTGAMEAAVSNCFNAQDEVLVINGGKFGERWREICRVYGLKVHEIVIPWGEAVTPDQVNQFITANRNIRGVFLQASETSTGVKHPTKEIAELTQHRDDILLVVDAITGIGVFDVNMDSWGIDILITGSQKGLMLPPGLAMLALSKKSWKFAETSTLPKYYLDLKKELKNQQKFQTAYTPAIPLIIGLNAALDMIFEEGLDKVFARHERLMKACRKAAQILGFELAAKDSPTPACTPIAFPKNFQGKEFLVHMRKKYACYFAGGQDSWEGKIFRIGHMGYFNIEDLREGFEALCQGFTDFRHPLPNTTEALNAIRELK